MIELTVQFIVMKTILFNILLLFFAFQKVAAQDSIQHRVILLGNAGSINGGQQAVISNALLQAKPGNTIVLFLGNNISPKGIELTSKRSGELSADVLRSQYQEFRKKGIPVYFIPGIADWDNNGPAGYEKVVRFNEFIKSQNDSLLRVIPENACPGPYEIALSDKVVLVALDTEWWLYPFDKHIEEAECECKSQRSILGKLNDIIERNNEKLILLATSHPFASYGIYGGHYPIQNHVFPFKKANNSLYIPLPVISSVYPLFRKTFPPAKDLTNRDYEDMRRELSLVLKSHPNIVHVSGHENSLQLIQGDVLQLISGSVSEVAAVRKGKAKYAEGVRGYAIADISKDNSVNVTFSKIARKKFETSFVYKRVFQRPEPIVQDQSTTPVRADSIRLTLNAEFDKASGLHRSLFGENYRKVWATKTTFPVLKLSETDMQPKELGGGMQTHSLRLIDKQKKEWVFRSIDKFPDKILPELLAKSFAAGVIKDNVTAIFPYAPLTVPVFSNALGVPSGHPKIVYIAPDRKLGIYSKEFANTVNLFEEREPLGKSISTINMMGELKKDNDNTVDQRAFLMARLLDVFIGDWDRHGDQWRWVDVEKGKGKTFKGVPRDRDQVFFTNQGFFLKLLALPWVMPKFQGFGEKIKDINTLSFNARFIDGIFTNKLSKDDWLKTSNVVVNKLTDSVIETALEKLPPEVQRSSSKKLALQLKKRRQDLLRATPVYYKFLNKVVDLAATDEGELVSIKDTAGGALKISFNKFSKTNETGKEFYSRVFEPSVTKEVRLFLHSGADSIIVANNTSPIKLRIIGNDSASKTYTINGKGRYLRKIHVYEGADNATFNGTVNRTKLHLSDDAANTSFKVTNRYNKAIPLINAGYNIDDGFMLGAGIKLIRQGFRKEPYASMQQLSFAHSFSTSAFRFNYKGEWLQSLGKNDFLLNVKAYAPDNTQNFFGRGNETAFNKTGNYRRYYRTRFSLYQVDPLVRWNIGKRSNITTGPSMQYYHFDERGNDGRFIKDVSKTGSYDSATYAMDKVHGGISSGYFFDSRNNKILPTNGSFIATNMFAYTGLNNHSKSFLQVVSELAVYKSLDRKSTVVIANRLGGGVTTGKTAFYQSLFLGGHENLRGYHQYRFAGEQMLYNNLEARIKLADVVSTLIPGQLGLLGFYDVGRVWQQGLDNGNVWHHGVGGGLYFAPANLAVLQFVAGSSKEGVYPYFTMAFRF